MKRVLDPLTGTASRTTRVLAVSETITVLLLFQVARSLQVSVVRVMPVAVAFFWMVSVR